MITTRPFSFIQFDQSSQCLCDVPLIVSDIDDIKYYIESDEQFKIGFASMSGDVIVLSDDDKSQGWFNLVHNPELYFACGDCFRIILKNAENTLLSNLLRYDNDPDHTILLEYKSKDSSYFSFGNNSNRVRLPMILSNQNPITEKEDYTDANGVINNPFKTRRQKYDLIIDFLPADFHKKLELALMHDITLDGISMIETGDYKIDWENVDQSTGIDLIMAKTEISEQEILTIKNS